MISKELAATLHNILFIDDSRTLSISDQESSEFNLKINNFISQKQVQEFLDCTARYFPANSSVKFSTYQNESGTQFLQITGLTDQPQYATALRKSRDAYLKLCQDKWLAQKNLPVSKKDLSKDDTLFPAILLSERQQKGKKTLNLKNLHHRTQKSIFKTESRSYAAYLSNYDKLPQIRNYQSWDKDYVSRIKSNINDPTKSLVTHVTALILLPIIYIVRFPLDFSRKIYNKIFNKNETLTRKKRHYEINIPLGIDPELYLEVLKRKKDNLQEKLVTNSSKSAFNDFFVKGIKLKEIDRQNAFEKVSQKYQLNFEQQKYLKELQNITELHHKINPVDQNKIAHKISDLYARLLKKNEQFNQLNLGPEAQDLILNVVKLNLVATNKIALIAKDHIPSFRAQSYYRTFYSKAIIFPVNLLHANQTKLLNTLSHEMAHAYNFNGNLGEELLAEKDNALQEINQYLQKRNLNFSTNLADNHYHGEFDGWFATFIGNFTNLTENDNFVTDFADPQQFRATKDFLGKVNQDLKYMIAKTEPQRER